MDGACTARGHVSYAKDNGDSHIGLWKVLSAHHCKMALGHCYYGDPEVLDVQPGKSDMGRDFVGEARSC